MTAPVAIVGAGLAGLTAAYRLARAGLKPIVFERYPKPGGLARVIEVGGEPLEVFYHHLFTNDTAITALIEELGLDADLEWLPSRMGIWTENRLWDFGTPASLLRFKPLPWKDKIRFVIGTLRLQRTDDPTPFEDITAADWIKANLGERVWQTVWAPLLHQKFAEMADQVAMVWLWRKIWLRGRSRSTTGLGERLGYLRGSFARVFDGLAEAVRSHGGELRLSEAVTAVRRTADGSFAVETTRGTTPAQTVLAAVPIPDYLDIAGELLPDSERRRLQQLKATAAICTLLELNRSFMPHYWLNIADDRMPFGGLIEHTNFIEPERYGNRRLLYISNYLFPDNPQFRAGKKAVLDSYYDGLRRINPAFDRSWIEKVHHFRADYAQPVVTKGYRHLIPTMQTPVDGMYLCAMAQIYPEDRGQNYAVQYGERAAHLMLRDREGG